MNRKNKNKPEQTAHSSPKRQRRVGKKTIHYILLTVFAISSLAVYLIAFFGVEQVTVIGAQRYDPDDIIASSGIEIGENLLRVDAVSAKENILSTFPYIQKVDVRRRLPPAIELHITYDTPDFAILEGGVVTFITRYGKILERGNLFIPEDVLLVRGLPTGAAQPGEVLGEKAAENLRRLGYLYDAISASGFDSATNVDLTHRLNMRMIYDNRFLIHLGTEANLVYKLDFLAEIIDREAPDAQGRIDFSNAQDRRAVISRMPLSQAIEIDNAAIWPDELYAGSHLDLPMEYNHIG